MKRILLLPAVGIGLWLILLPPAWWWFGEIAILHSSVALVLCLLPAFGTMVWATLAWQKSPDLQLLAVLGGSGVRLGLTLGVGAFLYLQYPDLFSAAFWGWVALFYLALLTLEIVLILHPSKPLASDETKAPW